MNQTDRQNIKTLIEYIGKQYLVRHSLTDLADINKGLCENFAQDFIKNFRMTGPRGRVDMMGVEDFQLPNDKFDWALLTNPSWNIQPPIGFNQVATDKMQLGGHLWLVISRQHFDAECPEGVDSFFDLPFFKRQIARRLEHDRSK